MMMKITSFSLLLSGVAMNGNVPVVSASDSFEMKLPRDLGFFGLFAAEKNRNKIGGRLECVYGDPVKGKMCPPVMADPMASAKSTAADEGVLETFSRCLDDPDDPKCRELQAGDVSPSGYVAQAPAHLRNLFGATLSPTTDDCGGNMFDPRFCASSMPSMSAPPTENDDNGVSPPTNFKIAKTLEPTSCPERTPTPFVKTGGSETCPVLFDSDSLPIVIEKTTTDTVTVKLVNTFPANSKLSFMSLTDGSSCVTKEKPDVAAATNTIEAKCDASGYVHLEVVTASPGFKGVASTPVESSCTVPKNEDPACSYLMAIPCACDETAAPTGIVPPGPDADEDETTAPTAGPTTASTSCPDREPTVQFHLLSGKCPVKEDPVVLASRTDKYAILELFQTWGPKVDFISALFMQHGKPVCASDGGVTKAMTEESPLTYTVDCGPGDWATMYLYVKDDSFNSPEFTYMPPICQESEFVESTKGICSYKVTVSCMCSPDTPTAAPFSSAPSFAPSFSPSAAPSFAPSTAPSLAPSTMPSTAPSSAPSSEIETARIRSLTKEGSFVCSTEKHGCEGGNVNICHYTSRIGYRTYCVPQADSEIVRFYSTDYCGKCTDGYTVGEKGEVS